MLRKILKRMWVGGMACMAAVTMWAQNPIICDRYTADPAPYVHGDTLYLFVDHDEDVTENNYFTMKDWLLYSTVDMVNWTYRGTPLTSATFSSWAKQDNDCWASQCIERNGKWYWYVTATIKGQAYPGIGVAVADSPAGPYSDPIRKPLVKGWFKIDPTVMIDDNGQAYLFYGNNMLWYTKLTQSMTSITGGEIEVKTKDEEAFGPYKGYDDDNNPKTNFEEASWIYKKNGKYYLEYAAGGVPEHWAYSTAEKITGPWTYQGKVMGQADGSFTIHGGSVEYRGHHYMFYHNGKLPGGGGYKRSTCVEEFTPNEDGSLPFIPFTTTGVSPLQNVNPYERQEAEMINRCSGVKCEGDYRGCYVTNITRGDYVKVRGVDFGELGPASFKVRVKSEGKATLEVRIGSKTGTVRAKVPVVATDGEWKEIECNVTGSSAITGVKDVFFTFSGTGTSLFDFDSWQFVERVKERDEEVSITVGNETRKFWLYVPKGCKKGAPLVVSLHGASGSMMDKSPMGTDIADKEGFIVVYPQGKEIYFPVFNGTVTGWDASGEENEDVAFIRAMVEKVASECEVDRNRIYCCGFSNGGMMTYALTNTCSHLFAGFASISGFPLNEFHLRHTGERPVPFLHIHGKEDSFVNYALMPVIVDEMVARLGANPVPVKTSESGKYDKSIYEAGEGSFPYVYYEVDGMGHIAYTPNTPEGNSGQTMWNFMKEYTLDAPCDETFRWRPRIETEGYVPKDHGWLMNSGQTLLRFGGDQNTQGKQNVYRSLQLAKGYHRLSFHTEGAEGKKVMVKLQLLTGGKNMLLNTSVTVGEDAILLFYMNDEWGEAKLTMTRTSTSDVVTVSNICLDVVSEEEATAIKDVKCKMENATDGVYNLSGIPLSQPVPGINIKNGKKVYQR